MMSEKTGPRDDCICTDIPKALYERVEEHCKSRGISTSEFIFDAISEKLFSIHRERRRKPRL
jgi:metal-responsive CopG/Arc/MetJ family transcriptional regulator